MALTPLGFAVLDGKDINTTPLTGTVTVPVGTTYVVAMVQAGDDLGQPDITSVLLDGDAFSSLGAQSDANMAGVPTTMEMFELENPTVGVGLTGTVNFNLPAFASVCVFAFYSGQDTTTPTEGFQLSTGTGTAVAGDVSTTTVAGDIILAHVLANVAGIANISTSDVELVEFNTSDGVSVASSFAYQVVTGSGAEVNWTLGSSVPYRAQAIVIKAAASTATEIDITPTQANNVASVSVAQDNAFTITATQANNVAAVVLTSTNEISVGATQANNTSLIEITSTNNAEITATQASNTAAVVVEALNEVDIGATQEADTASIAISSAITTEIDIAATQASNTASIMLDNFNIADITASQADDVASIEIVQENAISVNSMQANNIASVSISQENALAISATQDNNTANVEITQTNSVSFTVAQASNVGAIEITQTNEIAITAIQASDIGSIEIESPIFINIGAVQENNLVQLLVAVDGIDVNTGSGLWALRRYPRR